jgi:outer membrane protein TolC
LPRLRAVHVQQRFSIGAQLDAYVDNSSQVLYASGSRLNPFHAPTVSVTLSQPLLRGSGRAINLRFICVANINQKVSRLLFEQQLLETTYGISRLYYDLVSLGENIDVKKESLTAAQQLYNDDNEQVTQGISGSGLPGAGAFHQGRGPLGLDESAHCAGSRPRKSIAEKQCDN